MRSAFQDRLDALPETYRHARAEHIDALVEEFRAAAALQVIAVGSGGSFVTARLLARLVQRHHRSVAGAATPLEFGIDAELAPGKHLRLLSAEGANPDILAALDLGLAVEPARLTVLCNRADSPLASAAAAAGCRVLAFPTRGQMDGFLATHTLLLSSTLLLRAAAAAVGATDPTLAPIVVDALPVKVWAAMAARRLGPVIGRETLILVYDPEVAEAAWLVETNMWEAALGNVQIADLRNFAHGRHHWLEHQRHQRPADGQQIEAAPRDRRAIGGGARGCGAHPAALPFTCRGSSTAAAMSTSMLTVSTTAVMTSTLASSTG